MRHLAIATVLALAAGPGATTATSAQDDRPCGRVPVENWMSEAELRARVETLDLQIEEIDVEDGCYELEVRDGQGREFDILVHPETGEQMRVDG